MPLGEDFFGVCQAALLGPFPPDQWLSLCFLTDSVPQRRKDDNNTYHPEFCDRMVINEARQERAEQDTNGHDNAENHSTEVLDCVENE